MASHASVNNSKSLELVCFGLCSLGCFSILMEFRPNGASDQAFHPKTSLRQNQMLLDPFWIHFATQAMAWRVVGDDLAHKMYQRIVSLGSNLRPYTFILPNYPSYDDMERDPPYTGE